MPYIIKQFANELYWKKRVRYGGIWIDTLQKATTYTKVPTLVINNRKEKCYAVKVSIVVIDDPVAADKAQNRLRESYNKFWSRNKILK